jgi:F420H(2)-dependent quinone reductase
MTRICAVWYSSRLARLDDPPHHRGSTCGRWRAAFRALATLLTVVREVRARVATGEERDRLWPKFVALYPGYDFYQRHAKSRKIPIVILDPR